MIEIQPDLLEKLRAASILSKGKLADWKLKVVLRTKKKNRLSPKTRKASQASKKEAYEILR